LNVERELGKRSTANMDRKVIHVPSEHISIEL
jgi:hypothetical protein